jgi:hypothetical protein
MADGDGNAPSTLVVDTGDVVIDSNGVKTGTFTAVTLYPGLYWFAILPDLAGATNPAFRCNNSGSGEPTPFYHYDMPIDDNASQSHAWRVDGQGGTLPDPFPTSADWMTGNTPDLIYIQARIA